MGLAPSPGASITLWAAAWATRFLRQNHQLTDLPDDLTLLFEIISPVSRVVVDYKGDERLVLLGVRNRVTGDDAPFPGVREVADGWDLPLVPTETSFADIDTAMRRRADLGADHEGWVIRCADGRRWKVKGALYAEIHRVLRRGGRFLLRVFSDREPLGDGPHRFTRQELENLFNARFRILEFWEGVFEGPLKPKSYSLLMEKK